MIAEKNGADLREYRIFKEDSARHKEEILVIAVNTCYPFSMFNVVLSGSRRGLSAHSSPFARSLAHGLWKVQYLLPFVILFTALLCSLANAASSEMKNGQKPIIVTKAQQGTTVMVPLDGFVQVELSFLGSAGYGWHIEKIDRDYIEPYPAETRKISAANKIGGAIMGIWRFRALKPGRTEVRMAYYRAWKGPATAVDHFAVTIEIK